MNYVLKVSDFMEKARNILKTVLEVDDIDFIDMDTQLISSVGENSLAMSSIDYVDFLVCIEESYNIILDFDVRIYTIRDVYDYIIKYMNELECNVNE